jgi:sporulation protein YabP
LAGIEPAGGVCLAGRKTSSIFIFIVSIAYQYQNPEEVRPMMEEERFPAVRKPHHVILEQRRKLSVSGVEDVERFDESEISLSTSCGELVIRGEGLRIEKLSLDTGELGVEGQVNFMGYEEPAPTGGFFGRLFR